MSHISIVTSHNFDISGSDVKPWTSDAGCPSHVSLGLFNFLFIISISFFSTSGLYFTNVFYEQLFVPPCNQFHQHFYVQIFCTNIILAAFSSYVLALAKIFVQKCARKMSMKLTVVINFINIL